MLAITLARYLLYRAYMATPAADAAAGLWANRFFVGAVAAGCMWGVLGTALFPAASVRHQFLVIFIIGGMSMSAAVALAPIRRVFYGFTLPALVPLIVMLFLQPDRLQIVMGVLAVIFTVVITAFAVEIRESVSAAINIRFENTDLLSRLSAAHRDLQQANQLLAAKFESQERTQDALRQATQKFQALINASPLPIVVRDANGLIERWNPAAERMFGWSESEALGKVVPWFPAGKEGEGDRYRNMILRGETVSDVEVVRLRKDGVPLTVGLSGAPIRDEKGNAVGVLTILTDITARKRSERRQRLQSEITRALAESHTVEEALVKVIQRTCEELGWACGARWVLDKTDNALHCSEAWGVDSPAVQEFVAATRAQLNPRTDAVAGVVRRVWSSGAPVWVRDVLEDPNFRRGPVARQAGLHTALGFPVLIVEDFYGVMEFFSRNVWPPDHELMDFARQLGSQVGQFIARKQAEQDLRFVATHDALTALPNRTMFGDRLSQALAQAHRYHRRLALLFVDLDGFKVINDTLGHDAGDVLLREIAARLRACLREGDVIGRIGGDEFVVLIEEFRDFEQLAGVARKILETAARPVQVQGRECRVTASIGISVFPQDGKDSQTLLKNADGAMYRAKEQGKNRFQLHSI